MNPGGLYVEGSLQGILMLTTTEIPIIAQALKVMGYVNMFNKP